MELVVLWKCIQYVRLCYTWSSNCIFANIHHIKKVFFGRLSKGFNKWLNTCNVIYLYSSITNRGTKTFWAQNISLKKSMKFTPFIVYLWRSTIKNKTCKFHRFFKILFWEQNVLMPPFLILLKFTKSILTNFYYIPSGFTFFYQPLPTFHRDFTSPTNFYATKASKNICG